jgi:2-octaprenyl-6-methoxyphenol hydroxylase
MVTEYDIIIVGGGLTGAGLARCLAGQALRVAVVEAVPIQSDRQPSYDEKGLALSLSSQRILHTLGLWQRLRGELVPIEHIHVSDRGHFGFVRLHAEEMGLPALGYVVTARRLGAALLEDIEASENVDFLCPAQVTEINKETDRISVHVDRAGGTETLSGKLLVIAEGTRSGLREKAGIKLYTKDYQQTAILCNVTPARPHRNTAYERFTDSGPVALLPLPEQRCAVVLTVHAAEADQFLAVPEEEFLSRLEERFGKRLGRFTRLGQRKSYPIVLMKTEDQIRERTVFLGNTVHTIHPNGAQGFNLCLRDAAGLAETLVDAVGEGRDPGEAPVLENYVHARRLDQRRVIGLSDGLAGLFYPSGVARICARNLAMLIMDLVPPVKKEFIRQATGLRGRQPRLVRGLNLQP